MRDEAGERVGCRSAGDLRDAEVLRQQQIGPFFGWISYSIMRSERRDAPSAEPTHDAAMNG